MTGCVSMFFSNVPHPWRLSVYTVRHQHFAKGGVGMKRKARMAALIVLGGLIGYVIGPPVVQAATNLVTVKDPQTSAKARVTNGNLWTDSTGSVVYALTRSVADVLIVSDNGDAAKTGAGYLSGVSVNVSTAGSQPVTVNIRKGSSQTGVIVWQGTIESIGHLHDEFDQSVNIAAGFNVQVLNPGGASLRYEVYGCCFGVKAGPRIQAPQVSFKPTS
jgi:hypothetical protein